MPSVWISSRTCERYAGNGRPAPGATEPPAHRWRIRPSPGSSGPPARHPRAGRPSGEEVRAGTGKQAGVDDHVHLLVVEGDQAGDRQQLAVTVSVGTRCSKFTSVRLR